MSATTLDMSPRGLACWLEEREAKSLGVTVAEARPIVARKAGVAPGTLENLRRNRLKDVRDRIANRLRLAAIRALQADIERRTHELETLRRLAAQGAGASCEREVARLVESIARAQALIAEGEGER